MDATLDSFSLLGFAGTAEYNGDPRWGRDCPFCFLRLTSRPFDTRFSGHNYHRHSVSHCERCGWWGFSESGDTCNTPHTSYLCGVLQSFDLRSASVPIEVLELELPKWIEKIGHLNPQRMEDIVGRILANVWRCDVRHMGYTRDGGIDLLILDRDKPVAVQVKRRAMRNRSEMVSGIREFLGAGLLSGMRRLMYVTTAEKYSKGAKEAARESEKMLVESFELVSMKEIRSFLPAMPNQNPWDFAVRRANDKQCDVPKVPNPYSFIEPTLFPEIARW